MSLLVYHGMKLSNEFTLIKHAHSKFLNYCLSYFLMKTLDILENVFVTT